VGLCPSRQRLSSSRPAVRLSPCPARRFALLTGLPGNSTLDVLAAKAEFATIRECLIKIGARVIEHAARIRIRLPTRFPKGALFRAVALRLASSNRCAAGFEPRYVAEQGRSPPNASH
jgi:hypothetical protein